MPLRYQKRYKISSGFHASYLFSYPFCGEHSDLAAILLENQTDAPPREQQSAARPRVAVDPPVVNDTETATELGIWLSGLESFLAAGHYSFAVADGAKILPDAAKEFRLTQAALLRCARLNSRLLSLQDQNKPTGPATGRELSDLATAFRDSILIGDAMMRSDSLGTSEWKAWCNALSDRLVHLSAFQKLIRSAELDGEQFLPEQLKQLVNGNPTDQDHAELALVLPRFAKVLKWLSVVGKMLEADEPLKPALLIFSSVNEQIQELITSINNRLERFPNEEAEMFASLDAASYTASIELKKVYTQELAGLARLRPAPSIYARMETAHSLLNEGFQQMLTGFARLIDPKVDSLTLFPNFKAKLDQSVVLRNELSTLATLVQAAEKDPSKQKVATMQKEMREFMKQDVRFLFYKDTETVERFIEEILITKQNKDLVPILHRFGAYLDTLFGQVNLRAVLANQPFEKNN